LLEIFDFLNKGITENVANNEDIIKENQIFKEMLNIDKSIDNI
jgi:hypothetical protein